MKLLVLSLWILTFSLSGQARTSEVGLFDLFELGKSPSLGDLKIPIKKSSVVPEMNSYFSEQINCFTYDTDGKRNSKNYRVFQFQYQPNSDLTAFMSIAGASVGEPLTFRWYGKKDLIAPIGDKMIYFRSLGNSGLIGKVNNKDQKTVQYIKCLP